MGVFEIGPNLFPSVCAKKTQKISEAIRLALIIIHLFWYSSLEWH